MAGAGYKLFNTGDVLTAAQVNTYLQEQVVMVFNDAAARTTALSGVLAEGMVSYLKSTDALEVYNGSAWVGIAADQTPLTTKGDLFTYSTTDARLAVGNNGESLVADSSATTGLRWQEPKALNPIINSSFQVWQRGTSFTADGFSADRWYLYRGTVTKTLSRQTTGDTTNLPNIQYCARVQRDSGNTATTSIIIVNTLETADSIPFAGKTVTLSFYARKGANYSQASSQLNAYVVTGTGTDQNQINGFTGQATPIQQTPTLTTTWQRFQYTGTIASSTTGLAVRFDYTPSGTAGAADYFEVTGVQLEVGSVATPYKSYSATLAGELAACQRYYYRANASGGYSIFGNGFAYSTTQAQHYVQFPVPMRVKPTALEQSGTASNYATYRANGNVDALTTVPVYLNASTSGAVFTSASANLVAGNGTMFTDNNTSAAYLGWSAEL